MARRDARYGRRGNRKHGDARVLLLAKSVGTGQGRLASRGCNMVSGGPYGKCLGSDAIGMSSRNMGMAMAQWAADDGGLGPRIHHLVDGCAEGASHPYEPSPSSGGRRKKWWSLMAAPPIPFHRPLFVSWCRGPSRLRLISRREGDRVVDS